MKSVPFLILAVSCAATLAATQAEPPTAHAFGIRRVRVQWQKAEKTPGGLVITGRITNVGDAPLTYTQVVPLLTDGAGRVICRGTGYLMAGPLAPGQSADFRGWAADAPASARLQVTFREAGQPVATEVRNLEVNGQAFARR